VKFAIVSFGCRANRCDAEWLSSSLRAKGLKAVHKLHEADVIVINTCTVTAEASREARQSVRRARRQSPHGVIVVAGCAVEAEPVAFLSMPEVDYVANLAARSCLAEIIMDLKLAKAPTPINSINEFYERFPIPDEHAPIAQGRARAVLKIQDGCDNTCTYCIVPLVRGASRSLPTTVILDQLERLAASGHGEVVLTGIHLGSWGRDLTPARSLDKLLKVILAKKSLPRIRLSSIDPTEINAGLMNIITSDSGLCPHLHLPIQSADDKILEAMGRRYTAREAGVRIRLLRQAMPDMAIGLDVIVGFPGETDKRFERTLKNLEALPFDYLHVFPYSPRPGTPALSFPGKVARNVVIERGHILREMSAKRRESFWRGQLGTVRKTLIESHLKNGKGWRGRTDNYIPVHIGPGDWGIGEILPVRLMSMEERIVRGEVSM